MAPGYKVFENYISNAILKKILEDGTTASTTDVKVITLLSK